MPRQGWDMLPELGRLVPLCTEADPNPGPYCITVSDALGHTLARANAHSYADAAAFADSLADDNSYACSITVTVTYAVCSADG